jgi:hypothetical protein
MAFIFLFDFVELLLIYLLSFPIDICPDITTALGPLLHVAFLITQVPVLFCLKVTHSKFCC